MGDNEYTRYPAESENITGVITEIERYAIHDGPGIRTTVFCKGCPLRCRWCCNPETQQPYPEMLFFEEKCLGCQRCIRNCAYAALEVTKDGFSVNREKCARYCCSAGEGFNCCSQCYAEARYRTGDVMTVDGVMDVITRDIGFYKKSGGGVTVSGGEPLLQPEFTSALLAACKAAGIHTALETSGVGSPADYKKVLPDLDMLFIDLKSTNIEKYKEWTGGDANHSLNVIKMLSEVKETHGYPIGMFIRVPIIPGFNDDQTEIENIAAFYKAHCEGFSGIELLPYHRLGRGKYKSLGLTYAMPDISSPADQQMDEKRQFLLNRHIPVYIF